MLGLSSIEAALNLRPDQMKSMAPETWDLMRRAFEGGALATEFEAAWSNGRAFLAANDALRGRIPIAVEWKGGHRAPGDEVAPVDLRVDHVFLVSCKYLSRVLINASPAHLFERLLQGGHGTRDPDWFSFIAGRNYQALYECVREYLDPNSLPLLVGNLLPQNRKEITSALVKGWPAEVDSIYQEFVTSVAVQTAQRWNQHADTALRREALLWRMLRIGSAPYFVLGSSKTELLRLRIATPWDWRRNFRFLDLDISAQEGGQPRVGWRAVIEDRNTRTRHEVLGHVEIRWSHGRFSGNPEAKVYLDTPHAEVPGYFRLA